MLVLLLLAVSTTHGGYVAGPYALNQADANEYCQSVYGTALASIHSLADNNAVAKLCEATGRAVCWIGRYCPDSIKNCDGMSWSKGWAWYDGTTPSPFDNFASGTEEPSHRGNIIYPSQAPSNAGEWDDWEEEDTDYFICNTTPEPTPYPSPNPSTQPSRAPSRPPTQTPTLLPSEDPTASPTNDPSTDPTDDPSTDPTDDPSTNPSRDPTMEPSMEPSTQPTDIPTSASPTDVPTHNPTIRPTTYAPTLRAGDIDATADSDHSGGVHTTESAEDGEQPAAKGKQRTDDVDILGVDTRVAIYILAALLVLCCVGVCVFKRCDAKRKKARFAARKGLSGVGHGTQTGTAGEGLTRVASVESAQIQLGATAPDENVTVGHGDSPGSPGQTAGVVPADDSDDSSVLDDGGDGGIYASEHGRRRTKGDDDQETAGGRATLGHDEDEEANDMYRKPSNQNVLTKGK